METPDTAPTAGTEEQSLEKTIKPDTVKEKTKAKYSFTARELGELGKKLATTRKDIARLEDELDSVKASYKHKINVIELDQDEICRKLDDGYEMIDVQAIVTFNEPVSGRKTYRHEDTGELIREEAMTYSDFQLPMFKKEEIEVAAPHVPGEPEEPKEPRHETLEDGSKVTRKTTKVANPTASSPIGVTNLGNVLTSTVADTEAPLLDLDLTGNNGKSYTSSSLMRAFKKAAFGRWSDLQISTMESLMREKDTVPGMMATLAPHVLRKEEPSVDPEPEPFGPTEEENREEVE